MAALTAGPGVTNGVSAIAGAQANNSPVCVLGGRAPEMRWGSGSLQEIDHLPFVEPLVKSAETVKDAGPDRRGDRGRARPGARRARRARPSSTIPLDVVFTEAEAEMPAGARCSRRRAGGRGRGGGGAAGRRPSGRRSWPAPASTGAAGEEELRALAEALGIPVFLNGLGRGCLPADHELCLQPRPRGRR